ncbi:MAG: M23 family metallopeptidase [Pseudomonadota bacterium]
MPIAELTKAALAAAFLVSAVGATRAQETPSLGFPVLCTLGEDCMIQQTPDRDPGPGHTDYTCGTLAYDGHTGTDIRLPTRAAMRAGVDVVAAAPGRVRATRDAMADIASDEPGAPDVAGRGCGNGVVLTHAGGWVTQYCHLAQGSIAVRQGDVVAAGTVLGRIGLSGETHFPHLEFILRDPSGATVDPGDGQPLTAGCDADGKPLWAEEVPLQPGGLLTTGLTTDAVPSYADVRDHAPNVENPSKDAAALILWAHFFGLREGDVIALAIGGPDGEELVRDVHTMEKDRAAQFRAAGRRRPEAGWPPGTYRAQAGLFRGRELVAQQRREFTIP